MRLYTNSREIEAELGTMDAAENTKVRSGQRQIFKVNMQEGVDNVTECFCEFGFM